MLEDHVPINTASIPSHSLAVDTLIVFLFQTAEGRVEPVVTGVGPTEDSSAAN